MQQRGPKTNNVGLLYLVCLRSVADGLCVLKYRYTLLLTMVYYIPVHHVIVQLLQL